MSEAIRRAVVQLRDALLGVALESRRGRRETLERLFDLFEGNGPGQGGGGGWRLEIGFAGAFAGSGPGAPGLRHGSAW